MEPALMALSVLNSMGREIASTLSVEKLILKALKAITGVMESDFTLFYLRQRQQMILKGIFPDEPRFEKVGVDIKAVGDCLCGLAGTGEVIYSEDIHSNPQCVLANCKQAGVQSFAAVPVMVQKEVLGVLSLASLTKRDFSGQSDFIEAITAQLALALKTALLYEEMSGQVEELERSVENQKKMELALRQSEERYQIVSGLTSDYSYAYRVEAKGELVNEWVTGPIKRLTGYSKAEVYSRGGWESLVHPEDTSIPKAQYEALIQNQAKVVEYRIIAKNGETRWMRDYARPVFDKTQKRLKFIYGAVQDISERKSAELALLESEEKYRNLVENINDTIFLADKDGKLLYISPSIKEVAGFEPSELIGQNGANFIFNADIPKLNQQYRDLIHRIITPAEYRIVTKAGVTRWVRISGSPIFEANQMTGIRGILTDIDASKRVEEENRRLQRQLQQAQKMEAIGTLAGGIAHDFNNILAAVIGYTEMALVGVEKDTALYQNLQEVFKAGGRAKDLVKQILTFSRQAKQDRQPIQLKLIVKEALKFIRASLPTSIKIHQSIESDSLVMADPTQVYQIIMNLCTNAGHAMKKEGGRLEVGLSNIHIGVKNTGAHPKLKTGPYIELTVTDSGHGIPKSLLDRIFDPFFTTKEKGEGTGMGLSVVHGIVGSHGGDISVTSEPDQGTTFTVHLPIIKKISKSAVHKTPEPGTGTEHILLVDDETALANIGKQILESLGYRVTCRTSSVEALELFKAKEGKFDLVVTDMTMPNMAGDVLAREMLQINPKIPVILCSGYSSRIDERQALAMGIRAFLSKPILRNEIAAAVRRLLDESQDSGPE